MSKQGILYIVATPIGNLDDMSQRAIDILKSVDVIAAEDTRHSQSLLSHYAISARLISLHAHNEAERSSKLIQTLLAGEDIALISDAGTPLISDPGFNLVDLAHEHAIKIVPIPGACAVIAALSAAGLACDNFQFCGFLPAKQSARRQHLDALLEVPHTLIFYESPHRIVASLKDMRDSFGAERLAVLARELTKTFETIKRMPLAALVDWVIEDDNQQKGEFVVIVQGATQPPRETQAIAWQHVLEVLMQELPLKQAVKLTATITGMSKNSVYDYALQLKGEAQ